MISRRSAKRSAWRMIDRALVDGERPRTWWEIALGIALLVVIAYLIGGDKWAVLFP